MPNMIVTDPSLPCHRQDLSTPAMIFGGVLIAAAALCGTLDITHPTPLLEEVRVLGNENAYGPAPLDLHSADCRINFRGESQTGGRLRGDQCANRKNNQIH